MINMLVHHQTPIQSSCFLEKLDFEDSQSFGNLLPPPSSFLDDFFLTTFQEVTKEELCQQRSVKRGIHPKEESEEIDYASRPKTKKRKIEKEPKETGDSTKASIEVPQKSLPVPSAQELNTSAAAVQVPSCSELPEDFLPRPWSVIVGRDKASLDAPGNRRLHVVVSWYLDKYVQCGNNKDKKSSIISEIESTVTSANQGLQGSFIKFHDGKWWEVHSSVAREKIGRMLRESLHTKYSSSSRRKRARRRMASKGTKTGCKRDS